MNHENGGSYIAMWDFSGNAVGNYADPESRGMYSVTPCKGTTVMFYKTTPDWTQNIICTLDLKGGKVVECYTTQDNSLQLSMTGNENFVFAEGGSKLSHINLKTKMITPLGLPEYFPLKTAFKGEYAAILWKNSSDQILYTLIKGTQILFTKIIL